MTARSFYIAGSSKRPGEVAMASAALEELGFGALLDWTAYLNAPREDYSKLAAADIQAARDADLFVLMAVPRSYGAMAEFGARLASGKAAHLIALDDSSEHFFWSHPSVVRWRTWAEFLDAQRDVKATTERHRVESEATP